MGQRHMGAGAGPGGKRGGQAWVSPSLPVTPNPTAELRKQSAGHAVRAGEHRYGASPWQ